MKVKETVNTKNKIKLLNTEINILKDIIEDIKFMI